MIGGWLRRLKQGHFHWCLAGQAGVNPLSLSTLTLTATSLLGGPQEGEEKAWVERRQHDHIINETCKLRGVGTKTWVSVL